MRIDERTRRVLEKYVRDNPYVRHAPFPNQLQYLSLPDREALYGGAAGGGKSDALLMAALMFAGVPGYNAILFRRTYSDLNLPEAIMARSHQWLQGTDAAWNGSDYRWTFPSGATLSFGYMAHDKDKYRYQSAAFQFVGFDELTQFPSDQYLYLFSRLRRLAGVQLPLRMRGATNPGGIGHNWVFERFVVDRDRPFVPSRLEDNPHVDREAYRRNLMELDDVTRRQLEAGEWIVKPGGRPFDRDWWRGQSRFLPGGRNAPTWRRYISFDTALEVKQSNDFTAWTVGELTSDYRLRVAEVGQERLAFPELLDHVKSLARRWNRDRKLAGVIIEGKASGKPAVQSLRAAIDQDLAQLVREHQPRGSKLERMNQAAVWCKRGMVELPVPGDEWLADFESELFAAPDVEHDDRVDSFAQLVIHLENLLAAGWHGQRVERAATTGDSRVRRALEAEGIKRS